MQSNDLITPAGEDELKEEVPEAGQAPTEEYVAAEEAASTLEGESIVEPEPAASLESAEDTDIAAEESVSPEEATPVEEPLSEQSPSGGSDIDPDAENLRLRAIIEAIVYITEEPLTSKQIAEALGLQLDKVEEVLDQLVADYSRPERGLTIRELAGGYKMSTKPEHHETVRAFVKKLTPPLKLSLAALETLAVIAYKQPITSPEIMEIRGVQGASVLKTLLDRKLITAAGRKAVVGRPVLYKTTKEFLVQFGLKDLNELPTLKEFEELARMAISDPEPAGPPEPAAPVPQEMFEETGGGPDPEEDESVDDEADREAAKGPQSETSVPDSEQKSAAEG